MKTLVVLCALAAVTIAAPTSSEFGFGPNQISETEGKLILAKREKKAIETTEDVNQPSLHDQAQEQVQHHETSERTFKKGIIIKKTKGHHHLYRDSEEEKADAESGETCRKEVKVKICDAASFDKKRNDKIESDGDMHRSIKMAKEAVENLQKDLQKLENWNVKGGHAEKNHFGGEKDAEMHSDIEKARQALEHFQNNFETLESSQSSSSMMKDTEALEDAQRQLKDIDSETQRLAQWKETLDNIKKDTEIVKNIENSFKSAPMNMHDSPNLMKSEKVENEAKHAVSAEKEMEVSASEHHETTMNENIVPNQDSQRANDVMQGKQPMMMHLDKSNDDQDSKPTQSELKQKGAEEFEDLTFMKSSDKNDHMISKSAELKKIEESKTEMNGKNQDIMSMDNQKTPLLKNSDMGSELKGNEQDNKPVDNQKSVWHENDKAEPLAKSSDKYGEKLNQGSDVSSTPDPLMKSAKKIDTNVNVPKIQAKENEENDHMEMKTAGKSQNLENEEAQNLHLKEAEHNDMALEASKMKEHISVAPMEKMALKEVAEAKAVLENHEPIMRMELNPKSDVESLSLVKEAQPLENKQMALGKSANMEVVGPTHFQMRESVNKSPLDAKWKQQQNQIAGRGAYGLGGGYGSGAGSIIGAGSSGGPGAVGVFPNAKVGGCAIPLLLSCSPSVVSGSLAHSGGYAAPAYRAGEDMKFHKKRDTKKENKQVTKIKRTPTRIIEKIPYAYDKQL